MGLAEELQAAAAAAAGYGPVTAVLAAEPEPGERTYLVALGDQDERRWLVLDAGLARVEARERVRETASVVVLCELAAELAGGESLEGLRRQLAEVRVVEQPAGIEAAEAAALELERAIGTAPLVASPEYLDRVGRAAARLHEALSSDGSPFAAALAAASGTVQAFVAEVVDRNELPLR